MRTVGLVIALTLFGGFFLNGLILVASPKAWFRLPSWLRGGGWITEERYGTGWGGVQLRVAGAFIVGTIGWAIYDAFFRC